YRKAVDIDHKYPVAVLGLGEALVAEGKPADAVSVLEGGLRFGEKTAPDFHEALGHAEAARDSLRAAEVHLLQATDLAPNVAHYKRSLGDLYMKRKIAELAIKSYKEALALDANDLDTHMALGEAYYKNALYNDALHEFETVAQSDSANPQAFYELGHLYYLGSQVK